MADGSWGYRASRGESAGCPAARRAEGGCEWLFPRGAPQAQGACLGPGLVASESPLQCHLLAGAGPDAEERAGVTGRQAGADSRLEAAAGPELLEPAAGQAPALERAAHPSKAALQEMRR